MNREAYTSDDANRALDDGVRRRGEAATRVRASPVVAAQDAGKASGEKEMEVGGDEGHHP